MAAKVEIIYEAEASSLKATINEVNKANSDFGKLGERVLAFAMCKLDAQKY